MLWSVHLICRVWSKIIDEKKNKPFFYHFLLFFFLFFGPRSLIGKWINSLSVKSGVQMDCVIWTDEYEQCKTHKNISLCVSLIKFQTQHTQIDQQRKSNVWYGVVIKTMHMIWRPYQTIKLDDEANIARHIGMWHKCCV